MPLLDAAFPAGADLPDCARELLKALYPTVRWERVTVHPTLPNYLLKFTNVAVTLPDPLSLTHVRVFIAKQKWPGDGINRELLGILVHEAYHVLQYQQRMKGMGLGPLRPFVMKYLVAAISEGGGRENRYEKPAYAQETAFLKAYDELHMKPCAPAGSADVRRSAISDLLRTAPALVKHTADP
jgi:hypothetical protein